MAEKILKGINFPGLEGTYMIATGGSAEGAVLYTEQKLTDEQQAQARANIDVLGCDENYQYCGGRALKDISGVRFVMSQESPESTLYIETYPRNDEDPAEFIFYGAESDEPVLVRGVADGVTDSDAATVGQLNAALGDISTTLDSIIAIQEKLIEDIINFTIGGGSTYVAVDGMTWGDWIRSAYNTAGAYINEGEYEDEEGNIHVSYVADFAGDPVALFGAIQTENDLIIANAEYFTL